MSEERSSGRIRDALRARDFRLLCISILVDGLGTWASTTVLVVYVFERTGSTTWVAALAAARWIPGLLLGTYSGVIADRYERTRLMTLSALASFVVMAGLAVTVSANGPLWLIVGAIALGAAAGAPYGPASSALDPDIVPESDLAAANAFYGLLESIWVVAGPALGGVLAASHHPAVGVSINAASFLFAALMASLLRTRSRGEAGAAGESAVKALVDGAKALRANSTATALVVFCALSSCVYGASQVVFVRLSGHLGTGASGFAYLMAGMAVGGGVTALFANRLGALPRLAPVILGGIVLQAVPYAVVAWTHTLAVGFVLMMVSGAGMFAVNVLGFTALQRDMPRAVLGRVMGLLSVACLLATLVSSFTVAATLQAFALHSSLYAIGFGFPVVALICIVPMHRADQANAAMLREIAPRIAVLGRLDLFAFSSRAALEQLARAVEVVPMSEGADVVREGEASDALWVLVEGEVRVSVGGASVRLMGSPSYFGEIGLLHEIPRTATVRTATKGVLWRISGADFRAAIELATASSSLLDSAFRRLNRTHPQLAARTSPDSLSATS